MTCEARIEAVEDANGQGDRLEGEVGATENGLHQRY